MYFGRFALDCGKLVAGLGHGGSDTQVDELAWVYQELKIKVLFPPKYTMKFGIDLLIEN